MVKIKRLLIGFAFFAAAIVVFSLYRSAPAYKVKIFKVDEGGWGYDIKLAGETYIHQPFVPSIQTTMPFPSRRLARKTAYVVVEKMENGKFPTLSSKEIENLGIFIGDR